MKRTLFLMLAVLLSTLSASAQLLYEGIDYHPDEGRRTASVVGVYVSSKSIIIPSVVCGYTVSDIWYDAFRNHSWLTSISLPVSLSWIYEGAFNGCTGLTTVTFNAEYCGSPSGSSDAWFKDCPLTTLVIGDKVRSIPNFIAYNQAGLKTLTIGNSVITIGEGAFEGCAGLTTVTFNAEGCGSPSESSDAWFKDCPLTTLVIGDKVRSIPDFIAYNQTGLKTLSIPNTVIKIGKGAFEGCTGLTSISIPYCITEISANVFEGCTGLTSLTIPKLVTKIGEGAFKDCTGLTSVTIPNSVTNISGKAFEGCTRLARVFSFNPEPPVIAEDTFSSYDACIFVPKGCVSKYKEAEYWKNFKSIKETYVENIDINGDGIIDMGDVTSLISMILDQ